MAAAQGGPQADLEDPAERAALLQQGGDSQRYGIAAALAKHGDAVERANSATDHDDDRLCPQSEKHFPFLDITRICCVWIVAVDHGFHGLGEWNSLFGQDWTLQYLFLVCGVCYGMSKRSLGSYLLRLGGYAVLGICINWSAWLFTRQDWRHNFFGVIFHFWFVIGLMGYAILLAPLRMYLQSVHERNYGGGDGRPGQEAERPAIAEGAADASETTPASDAGCQGPAAKDEQRLQREALTRALVWIGGGVLGLIVLFTIVVHPLFETMAPALLHLVQQLGPSTAFWGLPQTQDESYAFLTRMSTYFMLTCTNFWLLIACPRVLKREGLTAWAVLLNTYGHRMLFYRSNDERPFHGLDLMTIALTCYYLGIWHRRKLGKYLIRYWFLVLGICGLLWPVGLHGRMDEDPPKDLATRARVNCLEFIFVLVWLTGGERLVQKEIFTEDRLDFLNEWSLILFLVHKAVHILIAPPFNWIFLVGLIPVCYLRRNMP